MSEKQVLTAAIVERLCTTTTQEKTAPFQVIRMHEGDELAPDAIALLGDEGLEQVRRRIGIDGLSLIEHEGSLVAVPS